MAIPDREERLDARSDSKAAALSTTDRDQFASRAADASLPRLRPTIPEAPGERAGAPWGGKHPPPPSPLRSPSRMPPACARPLPARPCRARARRPSHRGGGLVAAPLRSGLSHLRILREDASPRDSRTRLRVRSFRRAAEAARASAGAGALGFLRGGSVRSSLGVRKQVRFRHRPHPLCRVMRVGRAMRWKGERKSAPQGAEQTETGTGRRRGRERREASDGAEWQAKERQGMWLRVWD